ncbi:MAG: DinB family protein [Thermoanaerobaculia bacterium]
MKRALIALLVSLFAATFVFAAEPMTDAERAALVTHLERTAAKFEKSIEGLSEAQWNHKTAPERWSPAEVAEHVATSEGFIRGYIEPMMKEEPAAELLANARKDSIDEMVVDRSKKFQAIEPLQPTRKYPTPAEALAAFRAERQKTLDFVKNGGDFRLHAAAHPAAGPLDGYGWVVFLSAHTERHTLQIDEVKADAGYPK